MKTIAFAAAAALLAASPAAAQVSAGAKLGIDPPAVSPPDLSALGVDVPAATGTAVNTAAQITVGQTLRTTSGQELGQIVDVQNTPQGKPAKVVVETPDKLRRNVPTAGLKVEHGGVVTSLSAGQVKTLPEAAP